MLRKFLPLLLAVIVLAAISLYWYRQRENPESAQNELAAQNIELNAENFISEVRADHLQNVRSFLTAGGNASMQDKDGVSGLMAAVQSGSHEMLTLLFSTLPSDAATAASIVNLQDNTGKTALIYAVEGGSLEDVNQLLAKNADPSIADKAQETPLLLAVKLKHGMLVAPMAAADKQIHGSQAVTLNTPDTTGDAPLLYAIRGRDPALVKELMDLKADALTADLRGTTPFMVAAEMGDQAVAEELIAAGAKLDVADHYGSTPLTIAIKHSQPDFVKFLIAKGADPDFHTQGELPLQVALENEPFDLNLFTYLLSRSKQVSTAGPSLMFTAVNRKNPDLVKTLLDAGLSTKSVNAQGETLLYRAIETGNEDIALLLIDRGVDVTRTGVAGVSPLQSAAERNEVKVVKKLLDMGASPDQKMADGYALTEMAVYKGYPEVLQALLDKGGKLEKNFGILWSIRDGGGKAVPVLLDHGAQPNIMDESGDPAIWLAASLGEVEAVTALIGHHAAIDYPNKSQDITPLAIAAHSGQLATVKLLAEAGANLEKPDNAGMTPLAHAAFMTKPDIVAYLLSKGANIHAADNQGRSIADLAGIASPSAARDKVMSLLSGAK